MPEDRETRESPSSDPGWQAGEEIGLYHILDQIGEGGFGSVFLAEQREPVRRRVALKIIKLGMDSKEVIARFEAERQALAMMDHPNVAKVFDAGMTEKGRPYFAMEHVAGVSITEYSDEHKLSVRERIELFIPVCQAVQHAHQKGIIHRDLKPSNIMVALFDQKPVPKVIDFGIAKATSQQLTAKTLYTEAGRMIGTPEDMSPEQAGTSGLDVDTRTDVYALGVILYQLLSGVLPFDRVALRSQGYDGIVHAIKETEPPKLSSRVATSATTTAAQLRRSDARALLRELRGDLDWISMKAMEKDRSRRYETANGLAMDLQRFLRHEAVVARPPSAGYRMSRFVRKHRFGVMAGALVSLALIAGTAGTGWGMVEAREQRDTAVALGEELKRAQVDAETQRDVARVQRDKAVKLQEGEESARQAAEKAADQATELTNFMVKMLGLANPDITNRSDLTMSEMLDRAASEVERAFKDQPPAEARMRTEIGKAYANLGDLPGAKAQLERALEIREGLADSTPEQIYDVLWPCARVLADLDDGSRMTAALAVGRKVLAVSHPDIAQALDDLWIHTQPLIDYARYDADKTEKARRRVEQLAGTSLVRADPSWVGIADQFVVLGDHFADRDKFTLAAEYAQTGLDMYRRCLEPTHTAIARAQMLLLQNLRELGRHAEAESLARKSVERLEASLGKDHWYTARFRVLLARSLIDQKQYSAAEPLLTTGFAKIEQVVGPDNQYTIEALENLIDLYDSWPKQSAAAKLRPRLATAQARSPRAPTLATVRRVLGPENAELTRGLETLADNIERRTQGIKLISESVFATRRRLIPDNEDARSAVVGQLLHGMGVSLARAGGPRSWWLGIFREAAEQCEGWNASKLERVLDWLAHAHRASGQFAEAERIGRKAIALCRAEFGERHPRTLAHRSMLGHSLHRMESFREAEKELRDAYRLLVETAGPTNGHAKRTFEYLTMLYGDGGRHKELAALGVDRLRALLGSTVRAEALVQASRTITRVADLTEDAYALALRGAERASLAEPEDDKCRAALGLGLFRTGQRPAAFRTLAKVFAVDYDVLRTVLEEDHGALVDAIGRLAAASQRERTLRDRKEDAAAGVAATEVATAITQFLAASKELPRDDPRATLVAGHLAQLGQDYSNGRGDRGNLLPMFKEAIDLARAANSIHLRRAYLWLAYTHEKRREFAEGVTAAERGLLISRRVYRDDHWHSATHKSVLGGCLHGLGKDIRAKTMLREGYEGLAVTIGHGNSNTHSAHGRLVQFYRVTGSHEELAKVAAERLEALLERGGAAPVYMSNLSRHVLRYPDLPRELYELGLRGANWARQANPNYHHYRETLGMAQYRLGRRAEAFATLRLVPRPNLEILRVVLDTEPELVTVLEQLENELSLRMSTSRVTGAVDATLQATRALAADGPRAPLVAGFLTRNAERYANRRGDQEQSRRIFAEAVRLARATGSIQLQGALWWLAAVHERLGGFETGKKIAAEGVALSAKLNGADHWETFNHKSVLGGILHKLGENVDGERLILAGFRGLLKTVGPLNGNTGGAFRRATDFYLGAGRARDVAGVAAEHLRAQFDTGDASPVLVNEASCWIVEAPGLESEMYKLALRGARYADENKPNEWSIVNTVGVALFRAGKFTEAIDTLKRSVQLGKKQRGTGHPADWALMAMAHQKLGSVQPAEAAWKRARELMKSSRAYVNERETRLFMAEAEAALKSK